MNECRPTQSADSLDRALHVYRKEQTVEGAYDRLSVDDQNLLLAYIEGNLTTSGLRRFRKRLMREPLLRAALDEVAQSVGDPVQGEEVPAQRSDVIVLAHHRRHIVRYAATFVAAAAALVVCVYSPWMRGLPPDADYTGRLYQLDQRFSALRVAHGAPAALGVEPPLTGTKGTAPSNLRADHSFDDLLNEYRLIARETKNDISPQGRAHHVRALLRQVELYLEKEQLAPDEEARARELVARAEKLAPEDAAVYNVKGRLLFWSGGEHWETEARTAFLRSVALDPSPNNPARANLQHLRLEQGQP